MRLQGIIFFVFNKMIWSIKNESLLMANEKINDSLSGQKKLFVFSLSVKHKIIQT